VWASSWFLIKKKTFYFAGTNKQPDSDYFPRTNYFLGTFAKLIKATINVVISGCLSVRPFIRNKQLGPQ